MDETREWGSDKENLPCFFLPSYGPKPINYKGLMA